MLPNSHFEKIEKDAIDQINPSKPITKKVIEIKENALDKNAKAMADDEDDSEYDYYNDNEYDDDIDNDDIVTVTPKIIANKMCKYKFTDFKKIRK